jgi:hypothetical protein
LTTHARTDKRWDAEAPRIQPNRVARNVQAPANEEGRAATQPVSMRNCVVPTCNSVSRDALLTDPTKNTGRDEGPTPLPSELSKNSRPRWTCCARAHRARSTSTAMPSPPPAPHPRVPTHVWRHAQTHRMVWLRRKASANLAQVAWGRPLWDTSKCVRLVLPATSSHSASSTAGRPEGVVPSPFHDTSSVCGRRAARPNRHTIKHDQRKQQQRNAGVQPRLGCSLAHCA